MKNPQNFRGQVRRRPASAGPTAAAGEAIAKVSPARRTAFDILSLVLANKGHSDELLHALQTQDLSAEDRNLATALVMGVLRWQIALDALLKGLLERPEQRLAEPVAIALRMGAFQLLHLDRIPPHAALNESVELCRVAGQPHAAGMVNAVLRKVAAGRHPGSRVTAADVPDESTAAFAERLGHPLWLVERWVARYGRAAALAICEAGQREPQSGVMFRDSGGDLPGIDDGSRLVAEIAAAALPTMARLEGRRPRVWDCCAAPGGKTLLLARRLEGAEVLATDVSARRMGQTQARLNHYAYAAGVTCAVADATAPDSVVVAGDFDLILCDVPCSGTGTFTRNPEIRLRLKIEDLARQAKRQREILTGALRRLAPGGRLVYSTCSLEPEENEAVVAAVLHGPEFLQTRQLPVEDFLSGLQGSGVLREDVDLAAAVRDGVLRTLPGVQPRDGFFAVVIERT